MLVGTERLTQHTATEVKGSNQKMKDKDNQLGDAETNDAGAARREKDKFSSQSRNTK